MKKNGLLLILALFFVACNTKNKGNYEKIPYLCDISCVAKESDSTHYFIGFENGVVIKASFNDTNTEFYNTKLNARIYDVVEDNNFLWLGVRDRGLVKFDKSKNKVVRQNYNTSTSPKDGAKNTNYAVYDLA
ncbi:hypothetical protein FACS1894178_8300 [Bacteroidia bacterium]|nr:hypothetical protein FACS1894178_8300 [Bacteroidia bacterium]